MLHINALFNGISQLRDKEEGRRIFILANGPSILNNDLTLLKNEIVIGMNASTMLEKRYQISSQYYVVSDARFITNQSKRKWATTELSPYTIRVLRQDLIEFDDPSLKNRTYYTPAISRDGFSKNLSAGFFFGCTTTMLAIQLAWHLGSRKVYLLGCDLRYPEESPRFYNETQPQLEDAFTSVQLINIVNASREFERAGGELVNCSQRSFLRPYLTYNDFNKLMIIG
ncbi:MAG: DUF115 domain-containing protein [Deltaproteobacteria bacterium]|nr:DUF115 domain-containing protein [Deltaproteobacteria bacterium]